MGMKDAIIPFFKTNHKILITSGAVLSISLVFAFRRWKGRSNRNESRIIHTNSNKSNSSEELADSVTEDILKLQGPSIEDFNRIYFRDENELREKFKAMFDDGLQQLQIITDFDRTLSKARHMGKPVPSTHGILELYPDLTDETRDKFNELRSTYLPIEFDPSLSEEAKIPYMEEWWSQSHAEMLRAGVQHKRLSGAVADVGISLREGATDFLRLSHQLQVPLLIFSAGIGNVIEEIIDQAECAFDNIQVAANYMTFDQQGDLIGFQGQLFHTFNKTASSCADSEFCIANLGRRHVILLGDSTGDRRMADGAVDPTLSPNVIRIGFLNSKVDESLALYKEYFDIVLVDDPTFDIPNLILQILGRSEIESRHRGESVNRY